MIINGDSHTDILKITQNFAGFDMNDHLRNVADNLALIADLGYGSMTLALLRGGKLHVVAARRTTTAIGPEVKQRVGAVLPKEELEAYEAVNSATTVQGKRLRVFHDADKNIDISFFTSAHPLYNVHGTLIGLLVRDVASAQHDTPGRMESEFMLMAEELIELLAHRTLVDEDGTPFVTTRRPGDGVMRIDAQGYVEYPSPNAVAILRLAGFESRVRTSHASELPGGGYAITSVVNNPTCTKREICVASRTLLYRSIGLVHGAVVLVEDVTELRAQQQQVVVKETTIREVHHRVKNNLQTVAALLRMQARRTSNAETKEALGVAIERINSMAAVHALLSASEAETLDLFDVCQSVVSSIEASMKMQSLCEVTVHGEHGTALPAPVVTSLALVLTELVHNAYEHGLHIRTHKLKPESACIYVQVSATSDEIVLEVADNGPGLIDGFRLEENSSLGLTIVKTIISEDLKGKILAYNKNGAHFQVRIPRGEWE